MLVSGRVCLLAFFRGLFQQICCFPLILLHGYAQFLHEALSFPARRSTSIASIPGTV